jgi:hypothetical protein
MYISEQLCHICAEDIFEADRIVGLYRHALHLAGEVKR